MRLLVFAIAAVTCVGCFLPGYDKDPNDKGEGGATAGPGPGADSTSDSTGAVGGATSTGATSTGATGSSMHASSGSATGTASGGGGGGPTDACTPPAAAPAMDPCAGHLGSPMVRVPGTTDVYCVDTTEVSNQQYADFLTAAKAMPPMQPAFCSWNLDLAPAGWTGVPAGKEAMPVVNIDWCDAAAYCQYAGKRLCGKIGGGPAPYDTQTADANVEQWYRACSKAGVDKYPYSNATYDSKTCNGKDLAVSASLAVGTSKGCEGGYCGLMDMSGNVAEWTDECDGQTGESDNCFAMGGSFANDDVSCLSLDIATRNLQAFDVGFRCCAN